MQLEKGLDFYLQVLHMHSRRWKDPQWFCLPVCFPHCLISQQKNPAGAVTHEASPFIQPLCTFSSSVSFCVSTSEQKAQRAAWVSGVKAEQLEQGFLPVPARQIALCGLGSFRLWHLNASLVAWMAWVMPHRWPPEVPGVWWYWFSKPQDTRANGMLEVIYLHQTGHESAHRHTIVPGQTERILLECHS